MTITEPVKVMGKIECKSGKVSISATDLLDLLSGAIIATGKDSSLPTLTGIFLESFSTETDEGGLSATATDRYRLITGKTHYKGDPFTALLFNKDAVEVIRALKPIAKRKDPRAIVVSLSDRVITFTLPDQTFNFRALDGTFPKYEYLLAKETADSSKMAFNCSLLGSFDAIPTGEKGGRVPVIFTFHGNSSLVTFTVAHPVIAWRGGIMPMRYAN